MQNTVPHPRHRSVCHPAVLAIAPARVPRARGGGVPVDRGARGPPGQARVPLVGDGSDAHETPLRLDETA